MAEAPLVLRRRGLAAARLSARIRASLDITVAPFAGLALLALALRLPLLGDPALHHDESIHAVFTWDLVSGEGYEYDPVYHGPVQYYVMALAFLVAGVNEFAVRLGPALIGTALVFLPYFLRRQLGGVAALSASALLCITPPVMYFSRFAREDTYALTLTMAMIVVAFRFLERPRQWHPALLLGLLAASFATKESTFITVFAGGSFFVVAVVVEALRARSRGRPVTSTRLVRSIAAVGLDAWVWGLCTFATVFTVLFTTFLFHPEGLREGAVGGIDYWLSQHGVQRGNQPWFYYAVLLLGYAWPVLLLGGVGVVAALRRRTHLDLFLLWFFVLSIVIYSWAGERMPWLVVHPLLPLVLLAGLGAQAIWRARRRPIRFAGAAAALVGTAYLVYAAVGVSYFRPADPRELLVYTQTSPELLEARDRIAELRERLDARVPPRRLEVEIDATESGAWPWAWYLRDHPAAYPDMAVAGYRPHGDVLVVANTTREGLLALLRGYTGHRFKQRAWWQPDYGKAGVGDALRWLLRREIWGPGGSSDQWLYVRKGIARPAKSALNSGQRRLSLRTMMRTGG